MGILKAKLSLLRLFKWADWSDYQIPEAEAGTVMVDFLASMQEITNYLRTKVDAAQAAKQSTEEQSVMIS
jgi:hypothetical protein